MKSKAITLKWAVTLFSLLIVFQSCTIYQSKTSSLDEALVSNDKVRIILDSGVKHNFNKIERINSKIYGLKNNGHRSYQYWSSRDKISTKKRTMTFVQIYDNELKNIQLKNKTASTVVTVLIPVVTVATLVSLIYIASNDLELDWSNVDVDQ